MPFTSLDPWFEKGFRIQKQRAATVKRDRVRARCGSSPASTSGVTFSPKAKVNNIRSVIRRAPEVMVKITGHNDGVASVRHHLDYISRNGEVELTDESGQIIQGREALQDYRQQLKAAQIPAESRKREFLHVMLSMPPGTPPRALQDAAMRFCGEEFANRRFVLALHQDKAHTHVHVCVGTRDIDRADAPRLSPRKADLFRWRQGFAEKLRENGIDAAASERRHRFNYRRAENGAVRQIRTEVPHGASSRSPRVPKVVERQAHELAAALKTGQRPVNPHELSIARSQASALEAWGQVAKQLVVRGETALAKDVASLMRQGAQSPISRDQTLYDRSRAASQQHDDGRSRD